MKTLIAAIKHLRKYFYQYFVFEAFIMLITTSFMVPQFLRLYHWTLHRTGISYALNLEVLYPSILSTRFWVSIGGVFLFSIFLLIEYMILTILIESNITGCPITIVKALSTSLKHLNRLLLPGLLHILSMSVLMIPMFLAVSGFQSYNIALMLFEFTLNIRMMDSIWIIVVFLWLYLHIHTIYILYYMLIFGTSFTESVRKSFSLIRKQYLRVLAHWLPIMLIMIAIWLFLSLSMQNTANWVSSLAIYAPVKRLIVYIMSIGIYSLILLSFPFLVTYMLIMFQEVLKGRERERAMVTGSVLCPPSNHIMLISRFQKFHKKHHKTAMITTTLALLIFFGLNYLIVEHLTSGNIMIAAHRGDSGAERENSLESILSAIDKQTDYVEIDVMMTQDDILILHHDATLKRLTGINLKVREVSYETILSLDDQIPTLEEALELCKGQILVLLDIKDLGQYEAMMPKIVRMVEDLDMVHEVSIQSYNVSALSMVRALNPKIRIGLIMYLATGNLTQLDVDFYTIKDKMLTRDFVRRAKMLDRKVWVWTVNSVSNLREVMRYDIDGIITDYPARAQLVRGGF